ncbi:MAG: hypothetical protein RIR62_1570 [Pseudomonadota bacterium]
MWDWDDGKRRANLAKHGVDFAAIDGFDWASADVEPDLRHPYGEERFAAVGYIGVRLHRVIFTRRNGRIRLISLRKANRREQRKWASRNV